MAEGQARGPQSFLPRDIHEIEANELRVLDLTGEETLTSVGLSMNDIRSDSWKTCQSIGEVAHFLDLQGVMAPSATGAGLVIAAFEPALQRRQLRLLGTESLRLDG